MQSELDQQECWKVTFLRDRHYFSELSLSDLDWLKVVKNLWWWYFLCSLVLFNPNSSIIAKPMGLKRLFMLRSSQIFVFWCLVFWSLGCVIFFLVFFRLVHLDLQSVNKDYVILSYFPEFVAKSDQKPKSKNGMNDVTMAFFKLMWYDNSSEFSMQPKNANDQ